MTEILVTITGAKEVQDRLRQAGIAVNDLRRPMQDIGEFMTKFYSGAVFVSRGGVIGKPWASLSAGYAAQKAKRFPGRPPLIRSGRMQQSFQSSYGRDFARITNPTPYFGFHQEGTGRMPARVMFAIDQTRANQIRTIIDTFLQRQVDAL